MQSSSRSHGRNGMLEDQLLLVVGFQHHRIFVKGANTSRELDSAQQVNCDIGSLFACCIEEGFLDVLRRLALHRRPPWSRPLVPTNWPTAHFLPLGFCTAFAACVRFSGCTQMRCAHCP